jgi:hypothetical protein
LGIIAALPGLPTNRIWAPIVLSHARRRPSEA